jgi:hypothetical protein
MQRVNNPARASSLLGFLLFLSGPLLTQDTPIGPAGAEVATQDTPAAAANSDALRNAAQNPIASLISVPLQDNFNFNIGPADRTQNVLNIQPVEGEIGRYVKALGQAKLSIERPETEIGGLEADKRGLQQQLDDLERKINESAARDFNAELLQRTLPDFLTAFAALTNTEQSEALQCVLMTVTVHPQKLDLEIFELQEFLPGSQNRKEWLRGLDSNQDNQLQRLACYQLHYPGTEYKSVADLSPIC